MTRQMISQPASTPKTLEERLQPWIEQGEFLLVIVIGLMVYSAGWVDLLAFQSPENPIVLGRYSIPFFVVLVAYTLGFGVWFWLIRSLKALDALKRGIEFIQQRPLIYAGIWVAFVGILWSMFNVSYWIQLPLLEVAVLILMLLFTAVVLLAKPHANARFQTWRKIALALIGTLLVFELGLQALVYLRVLPVQNTSGVTIPGGRVYQNEQGFGNGRTNSYGWYYPEFRLEPESRRIILTGDTYLEALQIPIEDHLGARLDALLNQGEGTNTEVIAQGQVGYGMGMFMHPRMSPYIWEPLEPDELVVIFNLANDFQVNDPEVDPRPKFAIDDQGAPAPFDADFGRWHVLAHIAIAGHDPVNPVKVVASNLMSVSVLDAFLTSALNAPLYRPDFPLLSASLSDEEPFGSASFLFETNTSAEAEESMALAAAFLRSLHTYLDERSIALRLVTMPFFPREFYAQAAGTNWDTRLGNYDLLIPERYLRDAAADIGVSFLGMGEYMQASGMTPDEIQSLFFLDGVGYLTPAGHMLFAQAINDCFYNTTAVIGTDQGCLVQ